VQGVQRGGKPCTPSRGWESREEGEGTQIQLSSRKGETGRGHDVMGFPWQGMSCDA